MTAHSDSPKSYYSGSGELESDLFTSTHRREVLVAGDSLHVFNYASWPDHTVQIFHKSFQLDQLYRHGSTGEPDGPPAINTGALTDARLWLSHELKNNMGQRPGFASSGADLWAFYRALPIRQLSGAQFKDGEWAAAIRMFEEDGETAPEPIGAVAARSYGGTQFFIAGLGQFANGRKLYLAIYDSNDIDTNKAVWKARSSRWLDIRTDIKYFYPGPQSPELSKLDLTHAGYDIDLELFHTVSGASAAEDSESNLDLRCAITFEPLDEAGGQRSKPVTAFVQLFADVETGRIDGRWKAEPIAAICENSNGLTSPPVDEHISSLRRDPAGRLCGFYSNPELSFEGWKDTLASFSFATNSPPANTNGFNLDVGGKTDPIGTTGFDGVTPSSAFYIADPAVMTRQGGQGQTFNDFPVLEFVFYGSNKLQIHQYGTLRTVEFDNTPEPKKPEGFILGGYVDSPIPVPVINFTGQEISSGRREFGNFIYHSTVGEERETRNQTVWAGGFEAEGVTKKGVGPTFKLASEWGGGSVAKSSIESDLTTSVEVSAEVESSADDNWLHPKVHGYGYLIATEAQFNLTAFQFFDKQGELINDSLSGKPSVGPKHVSSLISMHNAIPGKHSFTPIVTKPGCLESYTPEEINARMKALGYAESDDYFSDIIARNALPFGNSPYLSFNWDENNRGMDSYDRSDANFVEQSWTFDTSNYAGISGGIGAEIFGVGAEFEFSLMGGVKYSSDRSLSKGKIRSWGIELEHGWGPLLPPEGLDGAVAAYNFRVYFLPVPNKALSGLDPNYWTLELKKYADPALADRIDPASACWRIVLVVDGISYVGEKADYVYHDRGVASVYQGQDVGDSVQ